jgi:hypothetical protein
MTGDARPSLFSGAGIKRLCPWRISRDFFEAKRNRSRMAARKEKKSCDHCEAEWVITYDPEAAPDEPSICPFCGAAAADVDKTEEEAYDSDGKESYYDDEEGDEG